MIERLKAIVREAANLMSPQGGFKIMEKHGHENIVTSSDLAVQDFLQSELAKLTPGCGFICEEKDVNDSGHRLVWIIDPIDGTANYARGADQCAICAGLCEDGDMKMSAVFMPYTDEMFWAERGRGAFRNDAPIHASGRSFEDCIMCTALPVYYKDHARWCADVILDVFSQCNDIRRLGAAAPEICYVAMGRFDMYFEYYLSAWDFAAASLILEEAGGKICDLRGRRPDFARGSGILCANTNANLSRLSEIVSKHSQHTMQ